jgi:hypothetical protein
MAAELSTPFHDEEERDRALAWNASVPVLKVLHR